MAHSDRTDRRVAGRSRFRPPITKTMRANARGNPNTWMYVIDEAFDPDGEVPDWAVVGAYPVNGDGEIVEDFHPNEQYKPSPKALGFPEPHNELEQLMQLVRTHHRPSSDLPAVVLRSELFVYAISPQQDTVTGFYDKTGRVVVPAYTRQALVPKEWPGARRLTGRQLLPHLGGHPLAINPHGVVTAVIPAAHLTAAAQLRGGHANG